jgi:MoaA/NifB/PqqE/SkfB family radical SAM enzyme
MSSADGGALRPVPVALGATRQDRRGAAGEPDRGGNLADKAFHSSCYAPTTSMYFDQFGNVRACCQNTGALLGNVTEQSLREIWDGARTASLRSALAEGDFGLGCGFCAWQVQQGDHEIVFARLFDEHPVTETDPQWPAQLEFSMTNSCNLQCVMCNGDWSSSIRTHRERRAPLPEVYGDTFFTQLAEFLPHLRKANFLGGEPFLGSEPLRAMSMLAELDDPPVVAVTTNGTQWSRRVEALCEALPISFVVSLDGASPETYESIRVGARFHDVVRNIDRFRSYAEVHGTTVSLAHCLMVPNWREFSRFLRFAEDRGLGVGMNEVLFPPELSLFQLPLEELREVVEELERDPGDIAAGLVELRHVWEGQIDALRHRLGVIEQGDASFVRPWSASDDGATAETWEEHATAVLQEWSGDDLLACVHVSPDGVVELADDGSQFVQGLGLTGAASAAQVVGRLVDHLGEPAAGRRRYTDVLNDVVVSHPDPGRPQFRVAWQTAPEGTTVLVAGRNVPTLPSDPRLHLEQWCGADRVVTMHLGAGATAEDDRIVDVRGALGLLGLEPGEVEGRTSTSVMQLLASRHGPTVEIRQAETGYLADTYTDFCDEAGEVRLSVRTMVDRRDLTLLVGVAPGAEHADP